MNIAQKTGSALAALGIVCLAAMPGHADIITGGMPNQLGGNEATAFIQANEFDLTSATDLGSVEFWDLEYQNAYQGSIFWTIYSNGSVNSPGAVIASGDAADVTRTATGETGYGLTEFADTFSIGSVPLAAGDYWLGLHNGPLTTDKYDGFYWASAAATGALSLGQQKLVGTEGTFSSNDTAHAFTLSAAPSIGSGPTSPNSITVPEPSAFALLGLGLLPLAVIARRRLPPMPQ